MARTAITATGTVKSAYIAAPTATNTGAGANNGVTITGEAERLVLIITGTNAGTASVKAGAGTASISAGQGDLAIPVGAGATVVAGPFESARFQAADGTIAVDTTAAMAVQAISVDPR